MIPNDGKHTKVTMSCVKLVGSEAQSCLLCVCPIMEPWQAVKTPIKASNQSLHCLHEIHEFLLRIMTTRHPLNEPRHEKTCFMPYANNKGADQPAHSHSLISAFVVRCLDSTIPLLARAEISRP